MNLILVFSNEVATVQMDATLQYMVTEWFAHPDSSVFRQVVTRAHTYGNQHQITKWVCNLEQVVFLTIDDQQWLVEEIFATLNPEFLHHMAYIIRPVVSEVVTAYHILDLVMADERLTDKLKLAIFTDIDRAQDWLFTTTYQKA